MLTIAMILNYGSWSCNGQWGKLRKFDVGGIDGLCEKKVKMMRDKFCVMLSRRMVCECGFGLETRMEKKYGRIKATEEEIQKNMKRKKGKKLKQWKCTIRKEFQKKNFFMTFIFC